MQMIARGLACRSAQILQSLAHILTILLASARRFATGPHSIIEIIQQETALLYAQADILLTI